MKSESGFSFAIASQPLGEIDGVKFWTNSMSALDSAERTIRIFNQVRQEGSTCADALHLVSDDDDGCSFQHVVCVFHNRPLQPPHRIEVIRVIPRGWFFLPGPDCGSQDVAPWGLPGYLRHCSSLHHDLLDLSRVQPSFNFPIWILSFDYFRKSFSTKD